MTLDWNYEKCFVNISIPEYIQKTLKKILYSSPKRRIDSPHAYAKPIFGQKTQSPTPIDTSTPLPPAGIKRVQEIMGTLLFYARIIDSTLLVALNEISTQQAAPTILTMQKCNRVLDYGACNPNASLRCGYGRLLSGSSKSKN